MIAIIMEEMTTPEHFILGVVLIILVGGFSLLAYNIRKHHK